MGLQTQLEEILDLRLAKWKIISPILRTSPFSILSATLGAHDIA